MRLRGFSMFPIPIVAKFLYMMQLGLNIFIYSAYLRKGKRHTDKRARKVLRRSQIKTVSHLTKQYGVPFRTSEKQIT